MAEPRPQIHFGPTKSLENASSGCKCRTHFLLSAAGPAEPLDTTGRTLSNPGWKTLGYWILGDICRYCIVLLLGDIFFAVTPNMILIRQQLAPSTCCKFGEKNCNNSRDIKFFLGDYFFWRALYIILLYYCDMYSDSRNRLSGHCADMQLYIKQSFEILRGIVLYIFCFRSVHCQWWKQGQNVKTNTETMRSGPRPKL